MTQSKTLSLCEKLQSSSSSSVKQRSLLDNACTHLDRRWQKRFKKPKFSIFSIFYIGKMNMIFLRSQVEFVASRNGISLFNRSYEQFENMVWIVRNIKIQKCFEMCLCSILSRIKTKKKLHQNFFMC